MKKPDLGGKPTNLLHFYLNQYAICSFSRYKSLIFIGGRNENEMGSRL